jgi:Polyketide cyclase / dehydrase and lipid transport
MSQRTARAEASSPAAIGVVWHLLSSVETWPSWSLHKEARLERNGSPTPNGLGAMRVLGRTSKKVNREEVVAFEAPNHFAYQLLSGMSVEGYRADIRLAPDSEGGTRITWESHFDKRGPAGWDYQALVRWVVKRWSSDLAKAAEVEGRRQAGR